MNAPITAGCSDGSCIIWDFETRGIAKEFKDKDCVAAITSVCWSKDYTENCSVFASDFKELDDNEEYVEREDELI